MDYYTALAAKLDTISLLHYVREATRLGHSDLSEAAFRELKARGVYGRDET